MSETTRKYESPIDWIVGGDTGISSKAIWSHMMTGKPGGRDWGFSTHPSDPDDFGRCYRLLEAFPEWRPRMGEMAKYGKGWADLVAVWDELTVMYETEVDRSGLRHRGHARKLYDRMSAILHPKKEKVG